MKQILFATTALVATTSLASAQGIDLSGSAEMGIIGGGGDNITVETQFHTDIDVTFTMSGETDGGLTFGATVDLDENGAFGNTTQGGETIFISGTFGTLTMGDTDSAFDFALTEVNIGGSINDDETSHAGFNGNGVNSYDGQIARYDYSINNFSFAVSAEIDDTGAGDPNLAVGFGYEFEFAGGSIDVGLGFENDGFNEQVGVSVAAAFSNGLEVRANYSQYQSGFVSLDNLARGGFAFDDVDSHIGVGIGYTMDALTVGLNYGVYSSIAAPGWTDPSGIGLAATYDLGGGAQIQFGYGYSTVECTCGPIGTETNSSTFSLGVAMSF